MYTFTTVPKSGCTPGVSILSMHLLMFYYWFAISPYSPRRHLCRDAKVPATRPTLTNTRRSRWRSPPARNAARNLPNFDAFSSYITHISIILYALLCSFWYAHLSGPASAIYESTIPYILRFTKTRIHTHIFIHTHSLYMYRFFTLPCSLHCAYKYFWF